MSKLGGEGAWRPLASVLRPVADLVADSHGGGAGAQRAYEESHKLGYCDGFEQGRAEGRAEGLLAAEAETEALRSRIRSEADAALAALADEVKKWQADCESQLGRLAVAIARKVLAHEVETSADTVSDIVREAIGAAVGTEVLRIRVSPDQAEVLTEGRVVPSGIALVADPSITCGCVVETTWGELDAQGATFLDRLEREAA